MTLYPSLAAALIAIAAVPAVAALPPQHQRAAELRAILNHSGVVGAFEGRPIDRVEFVNRDLYRVTAGSCTMDVAIVGKVVIVTVPGPRQFEVVPGKVDCGAR